MNQPESVLPAVIEPAPQRWHQRRGVRLAGLVLACVAAVYGLIAVDVVLRARDCYLQGEKYWRWSEHPEEKKAAIDADFDREKAKLERDLASGRLTQDQHDLEMENLKFDREFHLKESSIKYAYIWYKSAYELFSPPESSWVKKSREKAKLAQEKWKEELRARKIPFQDYMVE